MSSHVIRDKKPERVNFFSTERVVDIFVCLVLGAFPIVFVDYYFNILQVKYYFYCGSVILLIAGLLGLAFCKKEYSIETYVSEFKVSEFLKRMSVTDWALAAFLLVAVISTVCSDYVYESFWGNEGRYSGLFLLSLYGAAFFCVTRYGKWKSWYLDVFLWVALFVCLFGITDYFQMDLLDFKKDMNPAQKPIFTSTLGNINTYTAYVGMVTAVTAVLFTTVSDRRKRLFYYICMVVSFFAIIMGESDNAYLSLGALFAFLPLYSFNRTGGVKSYLAILTSFFTVIQCIDWINQGFEGIVLGIDSAFNIIIQYDGLLYIVLAFWMATGVAYSISYHRSKDVEELEKPHTIGNGLRVAWLVYLILGIVMAGYVCYDANVNGNAERYGAMSNYVIFNDDWGTNRGYIWRNALESFREFTPFKKLVGFGPDTFKMLLLDKTAGNRYHQLFDNAHNEYIHYLLTVGIAGLTAYVVFLVSFVVNGIRKGLNDPYVSAIIFAVICYSVQAFVNLNLPIATPIMWMFLMLGALVTRKRDVIK